MKNHIVSIIMITSSLSSCQETATQRYEMEIKIQDDIGKPLVAAQVTASKDVLQTLHPYPSSKAVRVKEMSNHEGLVNIAFDSVHAPGGILVEKPGYYHSTAHASWAPPLSSGGFKFKTNITVALKPVKNPIPMYAYSNVGGMDKYIKISEVNQEYGFDLMMAEALPPLGNGKIADFKFIISGHNASNDDFDLKFKIWFDNPKDGVVEFLTPQRLASREPIKTGSVLISDYEAPENGYVQMVERFAKKNRDGNTETNVDFRRNFYFRVRTKIDAEGEIISANYGKIYEDFRFSATNVDWGYIASFALLTTYFNPTPNDRNVEFDTKRNLHPEGNVQRP